MDGAVVIVSAASQAWMMFRMLPVAEPVKGDYSTAPPPAPAKPRANKMALGCTWIIDSVWGKMQGPRDDVDDQRKCEDLRVHTLIDNSTSTRSLGCSISVIQST